MEAKCRRESLAFSVSYLVFVFLAPGDGSHQASTCSLPKADVECGANNFMEEAGNPLKVMEVCGHSGGISSHCSR